MARRSVLALAVLDAVVIALTVHAHLTYHHSVNGPSVMPVGQLLGWALSVVLLLALVLVIVETRRSRR